MTHEVCAHERYPEHALRSIRHEIAQMFGEHEPQLDALFAADAALPPLPAQPKPKSNFIYIAPLLIVIGAIGLGFRLLLLPFRGVLRRREQRLEVARLDTQRMYLREAYDKLEREPGNVETKVNLAVMLATHDRALAERLFDEAVRATDESAKLHAIALHNRGLVRRGLQLDRLGYADTERARQLGFTQPRRLLFPMVLWFVFKLSAGLVFD